MASYVSTGPDPTLVSRFWLSWARVVVVASVPNGRWKMTTMISAVRTTGTLAAVLPAGATDSETLLAYVRQSLGSAPGVGDVEVMDNLSVHKVAGVRKANKAEEARLLYLTPYSPEYKPIENLEQAQERLEFRCRPDGG